MGLQTFMVVWTLALNADMVSTGVPPGKIPLVEFVVKTLRVPTPTGSLSWLHESEAHVAVKVIFDDVVFPTISCKGFPEIKTLLYLAN